jgi:hypothetical protein
LLPKGCGSYDHFGFFSHACQGAIASLIERSNIQGIE